MEVLPAALRPLAQYRQFIRVRAYPDPKRPGKTIKLPVHPVTGETHDAHDRTIWRSFDELAGGPVGFVFTEADPFFFVDIDDALTPEGQWNEAAQMLCQRFAGAAVEVSQSGRGMHIIATGTCPPHGCNNVPLGTQFYTAKRFVMLTGTHARGDAASDHTPALQWLVETHFPEAVGTARGEWQEGPVEHWRGPEDDAELLRRAMRSQSATALFGAKASFADLWLNDRDALARAFPGDRQPVDESAADAALASHLAFWTGCDGPRIERLMRESALLREKWDREDYLPRTIARVCEPGRAVCQDKPQMALDPEPDEGKTLSDPVARAAADEFARHHDQLALFEGCAYVMGAKGVWSTHHAAVLAPSVFDVAYGGRIFVLDPLQEKIDLSAFKAFTQSRTLRWPIVAWTQFRPEMTPGDVFEEEGTRYVNSYVPVPVRRVDGDVGPFLAHVAKLFPEARDRDIVLSYMAACVQMKGVKFQWCPVIQGVPGNGKTLLARCVMAAVGDRHSYVPQASDLADRFNDWLLDKVFYAVEDIYVSEDKADEVIENLKPMVTNDRLQVQGKGEKKEMRRVCGNFMMNMNKRDGLRKERNDRRFAIFFTPQQQKEDLVRDGMTGGYFQRLYEWLRADGYAIVAEYLHRYRISDEVRDSLLAEAPLTSSHEEVRAAAGGLVEESVLEAIDEGRQGFRNGWVSLTHLRALLGTIRRSNVRLHTLKDMLADMGYVPHPGLPDGRTNNPVAVDGQKRSKLYVRREHATVTWKAPGEIARQYEADQMEEAFGQTPAGSHLAIAK